MEDISDLHGDGEGPMHLLREKNWLIFQNIAFVPVVYCLFPETTGLTLEEIDCLFIEGSATVTESTAVGYAEDSQHNKEKP